MSSKNPKRTVEERPPLLSVRTALILLLAILAAGLVAGLILAAGSHPAEAALGGLAALGAVVATGNRIIGDHP